MLVVITVLCFPVILRLVSHLGPLLFILYTNDLPLCLNKSKFILFADDTTVYMSGKLINDLCKNMNKELDVLADWFHANKLSLKVPKTKYMLFSRSHPVQREETVLTMSDTIIKSIHCIKFLGLYIEERLDWQEHINACRKKLTSVLYAINKVNHFLKVASLKLIYYTLVYPYLTYGIILWGST